MGKAYMITSNAFKTLGLLKSYHSEETAKRPLYIMADRVDGR